MKKFAIALIAVMAFASFALAQEGTEVKPEGQTPTETTTKKTTTHTHTMKHKKGKHEKSSETKMESSDNSKMGGAPADTSATSTGGGTENH